MSGLILKLSPKERLLINGAVVENGDRRARLSILTAGANILRLRDAIHPEQVRTPVQRVPSNVRCSARASVATVRLSRDLAGSR